MTFLLDIMADLVIQRAKRDFICIVWPSHRLMLFWWCSRRNRCKRLAADAKLTLVLSIKMRRNRPCAAKTDTAPDAGIQSKIAHLRGARSASGDSPLAGAEGLEPSARGFGVDVGMRGACVNTGVIRRLVKIGYGKNGQVWCFIDDMEIFLLKQQIKDFQF